MMLGVQDSPGSSQLMKARTAITLDERFQALNIFTADTKIKEKTLIFYTRQSRRSGNKNSIKLIFNSIKMYS